MSLRRIRIVLKSNQSGVASKGCVVIAISEASDGGVAEIHALAVWKPVCN